MQGITRRAALSASAGLVLVGCGGHAGPSSAKSTKPSPEGPVINDYDVGNRITRADLERLAKRMESAFRSSWETFHTHVPLDQYDIGAWRRYHDGLNALPTSELTFLAQKPDSLMFNSSGKRVETEAKFALAHQISGVDVRPVTQLVRATIAKDPGGETELIAVHAPSYGLGDEPYSKAAVTVLESRHVVLIAREDDYDTAARILPILERGAVRAMGYLRPPKGASRMCMTLNWGHESMFGESPEEAAGFAVRVNFVDPAELAQSSGGADDPKAAFGGTRIVLNRSALAEDLEAVACHESIHALAKKWGVGAKPVFAEGVAAFFEHDGVAGTRAAMADIARAHFGAFRADQGSLRDLDADSRFYKPVKTRYPNYCCSAMMYAYVEAHHGRGKVLALAREAYTGASDPAQAALGYSFGRLLDKTAAWT